MNQNVFEQEVAIDSKIIVVTLTQYGQSCIAWLWLSDIHYGTHSDIIVMF